jgi:hypothetical protein
MYQLPEILLFLSSGLRYKTEEIAAHFDIAADIAYCYTNPFKATGFVFPNFANGDKFNGTTFTDVEAESAPDGFINPANTGGIT